MLEFSNKGKDAKSRSNKDVTINIRKDDAIGVIFRNNAADKVTKVNGVPKYRYEYSIDGNRLYFRGTSSKRGFACYKNTKNGGISAMSTYYSEIEKKYQTEELIDYAIQFEGDYDLLYDGETNLYYIESGMRFFGKK